MTTLTFQGHDVPCDPDETVLKALERYGIAVPNSCRAGVCQSCLMRATQGTPPLSAQQGIKNTLAAQGYFLACMCKPTQDMALSLPDESAVQRVRATVVQRRYLNDDILLFQLLPDERFEYQAGQFLQIHRPDGLVRSYSIASVSQTDPFIDLHIRLLPNGNMTQWLHNEVTEGSTLEISGANGNCFYIEGNPNRKLLLVGTGSGLAPLWGVLRSALYAGHQGEIHLFHGSWNPKGLYLQQELNALAERYPQFYYHACVDAEAEYNHEIGRADSLAFRHIPDVTSWQVYLCGHPEMVKGAKRTAFLRGANLPDIYADPFVLSTSG